MGTEANNKVELEFNPLRYVRVIFDLQGGMQIKTFLPSSPFKVNNQFDRKGDFLNNFLTLDNLTNSARVTLITY